MLFSSALAESKACGLLWSEHAHPFFCCWWVGLLLIPGCAVCRTSCQCVWLMWTSWRRDWMRLRSTGGLSRQKLPPSPCVQTPLITEHLSSLHERLGRPSHSQHQTCPIPSSLPFFFFSHTFSSLLTLSPFSSAFCTSTALSASRTLSLPLLIFPDVAQQPHENPSDGRCINTSYWLDQDPWQSFAEIPSGCCSNAFTQTGRDTLLISTAAL